MFPLRYSFGLNTNLFETNVLNLAVVVGIVTTFVGDAIQILLDQRRKTILSTLREINKKAKDAEKRLIEACKKLDVAIRRIIEIRKQIYQVCQNEIYMRERRLKKDLQSIFLEYKDLSSLASNPEGDLHAYPACRAALF